MLSLLRQETPLQVVGCINPFVGIMAQKAGYLAIYLSGAGVANYSFGIPDIGKTTLENVLEDVRRITAAVSLPLLVDGDMGFGDPEKTVSELIRAGAKAVHIEDQAEAQKKCGHLDKKETVSKEEMADRIRAAVKGKKGKEFTVIARCDAPYEEMIERLDCYVKAGADALFPEAVQKLEQYREIKKEIGVPVLANITEFGKTPLFDLQQLKEAGVDMALYPLSVARAMNKAALAMLCEIRKKGTQQGAVDRMQTRKELYEFLEYTP